MAQLTFANPSYLWVLIIVPFMIIMHFLSIRHQRAAAIKFSNFEAIERVAKGGVLGRPTVGILRSKYFGLLMVRTIIYNLLILAAAGTTIIYHGTVSASDYVLAIDASSSMLADDFTPSRLDAAKSAATDFADSTKGGTKIGIVTFSSTAIVNLRLTDDKTKIRESISKVDMYGGGGTAVGDAIVASTNLFDEENSKTIILLTDGQSNVGIDSNVAVEYARQNDIVVHTIGIGTREGGNVTQFNFISQLDEDFLKGIANSTLGKSFIVTEPKSLENAFNEISEYKEKNISFNISLILLLVALGLLGVEWILLNTIYKTIP